MRSAIIGCGSIAQVHALSLSKNPNTDLVACADIIFERAEKIAKDYSCKAYNSLEDMLLHEEIDVLHICTPHYLHTPMAKLAESKGIAIFTEKPPVISYAQWDEFSKIKAPMGICFQNRYNRSVQHIKTLLTTGKTGKILGARAFVTWCRGGEYYTESGWRGSLATEGGGVLINQSIHTMDLLVYLIGNPISVEATLSNRHLKGVIEVEDTLEAFINFDNEAKAIFYATTAYSEDSTVLLEINCENMTVRIEEERLTVIHNDKTREEIVFAQPEPLGKAYWGNGHHTCISDFYANFKSRVPIGINEIRETTLLMLGAYESARNGGKTIKI